MINPYVCFAYTVQWHCLRSPVCLRTGWTGTKYHSWEVMDLEEDKKPEQDIDDMIYDTFDGGDSER